MSGIEIEYLVGLFLIGTSLDAPRANVAKLIGGGIAVVAAALGFSLI